MHVRDRAYYVDILGNKPREARLRWFLYEHRRDSRQWKDAEVDTGGQKKRFIDVVKENMRSVGVRGRG